MVRISKQRQKRNKSPRRCKAPSVKTGPVKDNLSLGYKEHVNALDGEHAAKFFIAKIR